MTAKTIKDLFDQGKYQAVLDLLAQLEPQGDLAAFTEKEQIECIYYKSYSLWGVGRYEDALQIVLTAREKYTSPNDRSLLLALLTAQLWALCILGRSDEGLEVIREGDAIIETLTTKERETGSYWIAFFEHRKGDIYWDRGDLDTALEHFQHALALREKIGDSYAIVHSLNTLGSRYRQQSELDTALEYLQRGLSLCRTLNNAESISFSLNSIGYIYIDKGDWDTALEYFQQELSFTKKTGNPVSIARSLRFIGYVYQNKGELDKALDYFQECLSLDTNVGISVAISYDLGFISFVHYLKGELDTALDYLKRSLAPRDEVEEAPVFFSDILLLSGVLYHAKGELDTALERLQQSLSLIEQFGNDIAISWRLFCLICVFLAQEDQTHAQKYLTRLQQLQTRTPNKWIHLRSRLAEALVLKQSKRMKHKSQAQIILEQIVNEDMVAFDLTALAMVHLCDLLLGELKSYADPDVWKEVKALIEQLYVMAQDQNSVSLICEALLLRAKFATVDGKLQQALTFYEQARFTATEKNLILLVEKVDTEQKLFESEFEKWQDIIQSNKPLQERLKHARLEDYIQQVQTKLKIDFSQEP
ncbi:MAG: tetratricopeptide repeat protein [Candidatus Hermodarchaeota archaeon]